MKFRQAILGRSALAAILVASVAFSSAARAESVVVQGNSRVDSETIRSYFVGNDANDAVKKLYETGYFADVKISRSGGTLVVRVVENSQSINRVVFVGNSKVKAEDLEKETRLHSGGAYSEAAAQADVQRIADVYRRAGRNAAKVSFRLVPVPNGTVDVVYDINEGDKTGVKEIRFVGNQAYSTSKLVGMMETTEMNYLSWLKSSDVYDPDRIAKDAEAIRRYYLKNGYADFHVVGVDATFDPAAGGYIITISVEEGLPYTVSSASVESHLRDVDSASLEKNLRVHAGDTYNGDLVDKTVEAMTREVGRRGYAFTSVRPRGDRDPVNHTVALAFVAEDGPRVYVERINVHGNTATRDYVIRREFDIGEGDAYNKTLVDKAEKRLNSLGFFKKVKITNEQGTASDRVVIDVDVEEQSTGSFSVSGGYSTTEGFLAEVSVSQSNFLGRGEYIRTAVSVGQYAKGIELNYTEPFFLDQRLAAGFDAYSKVTEASTWQYYNNWVTGGTLRLGIPITDEITFAPRYTGYVSRLSIPSGYNDCGASATFPSPNYTATDSSGNLYSCLSNGEASLALKQAQGNWVTSMVGYTLSYSDIDNPRDPHLGISANIKQDFAGVGGDSKFIRTTGDVRYYHELYFDNVVGIARVQGGNITAWGNEPLRIVDNFNLGNSLVRGFAPGGIGPRDVTNSAYFSDAGNALGGTNYYGGSLEVQTPIWGIPKDLGLKLAVFADAGNLSGYKGTTNLATYAGFPAGTSCAASASKIGQVGTAGSLVTQPVTQAGCVDKQGDNGLIRSSVGVGLIWASPMGPIRFNYAFATSKSSADVLQQFSFSGGTSF
jgi:outer membrane protein insertion porin family